MSLVKKRAAIFDSSWGTHWASTCTCVPPQSACALPGRLSWIELDSTCSSGLWLCSRCFTASRDAAGTWLSPNSFERRVDSENKRQEQKAGRDLRIWLHGARRKRRTVTQKVLERRQLESYCSAAGQVHNLSQRSRCREIIVHHENTNIWSLFVSAGLGILYWLYRNLLSWSRSHQVRL